VKYAVEEVVDWDPATFDRTRTAEGVTISGPCPRCAHAVDKRLRAVGIFAFDEGVEDEPEDEVIRCNCLHTHDGGEAGKGCGGYWGVEIARE
jgi:hypothetical protein